MMDTAVDVAVVGAGLSGLTCARLLQQWGHSVAVFDKSLGLGGRVATRRIGTTCFDHGARYMSAQGAQTNNLINRVRSDSHGSMPSGLSAGRPSDRLSLTSWPRYPHVLCEAEPYAEGSTVAQASHVLPNSCVPPNGMTAIAKFLGKGLTIHRLHRITSLQANLNAQTWELIGDSAQRPSQTQAVLSSAKHPSQSIAFARAVVLAVPAPQAVALLAPLTSIGLAASWIDQVRAVRFAPCLSLIGGYDPKTLPLHISPDGCLIWQTGDRHWDALDCPNDEALAWIGLDSSKSRYSASLYAGRSDALSDLDPDVVVVIHSSDRFASTYVDSPDLDAVGDRLLETAARRLQCSSLQSPRWRQVQRWRYAFCRHPLPSPYILTQEPLILGCAGDWCGGHQIEDALVSGEAIAKRIHQLLDQTVYSK